MIAVFIWGDALPPYVFIQDDGALVGTDNEDVTPEQASEWYISDAIPPVPQSDKPAD